MDPSLTKCKKPICFHHCGHAWSHPLKKIGQTCNFYGSLTKYKKNKFIDQFILEMKLAHYLNKLCVCLDISDHTHLKSMVKFVVSMSSHIQNSISYLISVVRCCILHSFWVITQKVDFSRLCGFCKKFRDLYYFHIHIKSHNPEE